MDPLGPMELVDPLDSNAVRCQMRLPSVSRTVFRASLVLSLALFPGFLRAHAQARSPSSTAAQNAPHPVERSPDAYAIYSLLVPGEALATMPPAQTQRWAIADTTVNAQDVSPALAPQAALKPPTDNPNGFLEADRDYQARKDERLLLTRNFNLDRPYILLNPSEAADFRTSRSSATAPRTYSDIPGITYFSPVFFNHDRTAALVYMVDWCGNLCSGGQWVYLEKQNKNWVRRSGIVVGGASGN